MKVCGCYIVALVLALNGRAPAMVTTSDQRLIMHLDTKHNQVWEESGRFHKPAEIVPLESPLRERAAETQESLLARQSLWRLRMWSKRNENVRYELYFLADDRRNPNKATQHIFESVPALPKSIGETPCILLLVHGRNGFGSSESNWFRIDNYPPAEAIAGMLAGDHKQSEFMGIEVISVCYRYIIDDKGVMELTLSGESSLSSIKGFEWRVRANREELGTKGLLFLGFPM